MITRIRSLLVLAALVCGAAAHAEVNTAVLDSLPVQEGGRKKPFYVFARETLLGITGKASFQPAGADSKWQAVAIVTDMWLRPERWIRERMILVANKPFKESLGFDPKSKWFSYEELASNEKLLALFKEVQAVQAKNSNAKLKGDQKEAADLGLRLALFEGIVGGKALTFFPPPEGPQWLAGKDAVAAYPNRPEILTGMEALQSAYLAGDDAGFAKAVERLSREAAQLRPEAYADMGLIRLENTYQKAHPFRWAWICYGLSALVLAATWFAGTKTGYKIAWGLVLIGIALQIYGFTCRVLISGRAPVTNMYESVIWVAFGVIVFAVILEAIYRSRYFLLAATPLAVVSLLLADTQPTVLSSSITPLAAVLRSNFWLSTHVTCITLGYAAFLLALGLGHIILVMAMLRGKKGVPAAMHLYNYRALQIGVLLLAIGTILGAVWANYSWGRFWDWDPKEVWALIALLSYLLILHGRIAGWWGGFGMAIGSVVAFQTVLMAWYGVNFVLGEGLHSYGFGKGGVQYVGMFVAAEFIFLAVAIWRALAQSAKVPAQARMEVGGDVLLGK